MRKTTSQGMPVRLTFWKRLDQDCAADNIIVIFRSFTCCFKKWLKGFELGGTDPLDPFQGSQTAKIAIFLTVKFNLSSQLLPYSGKGDPILLAHPVRMEHDAKGQTLTGRQPPGRNMRIFTLFFNKVNNGTIVELVIGQRIKKHLRGTHSQSRQSDDAPDCHSVRILMQPRIRKTFTQNDANPGNRFSGKIRGAPRRKGPPNQQQGESGKNRDLEKKWTVVIGLPGHAAACTEWRRPAPGRRHR